MSAFPPPFERTPYLLHLGLACFDRAFLAEYCAMPPTPLMVCCAWVDINPCMLAAAAQVPVTKKKGNRTHAAHLICSTT